ncbi:hypothetical protein D8674_017320 [Pyrus ussuriensis x Pyrus communis]|uniref:Retrotransposon Copia-like N-terminal domain-containing protein n=1 Tax=Pyrus ussuriensis x Pyrus communis TaxID=2448454 RepID=A0A5N5HJI4_9ROSA|nr:hypothetical protein D8674_017320 [Pyrus ussuriensis x Pyrus communis]
MASTPLKIEGLLGMLTICLQDDNFGKWSFQFRYVLEGYDLFDYFDGTNTCPPKYVLSLEHRITKEIAAAYRAWIKTDKALISLLIATLGNEVIKYIIELHTIKKGVDIIEKYLLKLKHLKDQLLAAGETVSNNDLIVTELAGLPAEYNIIYTLLSPEKTVEDSQGSTLFPMSGMYCQGESSNARGNRQFYQGETLTTGVNGQFYHEESSNQIGNNTNKGNDGNQSNSNRNYGGFNDSFNGPRQGNKDHSNERKE